jgi:pantoate--beta-alanine ligase
MQVVSEPQEIRSICSDLRSKGQKIALVPTMGYYHEGHLRLMQWARENAEQVLVSLFVNPTQFAPGEDFEDYPRDMERDKKLAREQGVDFLFAPSVEGMYSPDHATWVQVPGLSNVLCARSRPNHFQGVCTVVCKLLNLVRPNLAVFGQKDWQQLAIIKRMVRDLNMGVEIVGRPIVRDSDGLALSSRNTYLNAEERQEAAMLYAGLQQALQWYLEGEQDAQRLKKNLSHWYAENIPSGRLDYLELVDPESLKPVHSLKEDNALLAVALFLGRARLIDNILLEI